MRRMWRGRERRRRWKVGLAVALSASVLLSHPGEAQIITILGPDGIKRPVIPDSTGLADSTMINRAMFQGVQLTQPQRDSIDRLVRVWRRKRSPEQWTAYGTARMKVLRPRIEQEIERERQVYRAVLTPAQQKRYDANTAEILARWRKHSESSASTRSEAQ